MKEILFFVVYQAVKTLLNADWGMVQREVSTLIDTDLQGAQKHAIVIGALRAKGVVWATWVLDIAIKVVYARLVNKPLLEEIPGAG